ncbi:MAG: adenylate/guanylate cyclase domain-containing protein [Granulosicoccus sp.]
MSSYHLTVLFADLVGSTHLYQLHGDASAYRKVSHSLQWMKTLIEKNDGRLLRTIGDSALASFMDTDAAYRAAVDIQRKHEEMELSVRIGFHVGEVIRKDGDVYGNAVNLAARVADIAKADEICVTEAAIGYLCAAHRSNSHFINKFNFKGVRQPVSVYRVSWNHDSELTAIVASASGMTAVAAQQSLELRVGSVKLSISSHNPTLTMGRAEENDLVVDGEHASRYHARIELTQGRYLLHDTSTNGTYISSGDGAPEFVLRETFTLAQNGVIGLGVSPDDSGLLAITYQRNAAP